MKPKVTPQPCEVGCEAVSSDGLGLCGHHLDEWLRSPERQAIGAPATEHAWHAAMDRWIARKRREARRDYVN